VAVPEKSRELMRQSREHLEQADRPVGVFVTKRFLGERPVRRERDGKLGKRRLVEAVRDGHGLFSHATCHKAIELEPRGRPDKMDVNVNAG